MLPVRFRTVVLGKLGFICTFLRVLFLFWLPCKGGNFVRFACIFPQSFTTLSTSSKTCYFYAASDRPLFRPWNDLGKIMWLYLVLANEHDRNVVSLRHDEQLWDRIFAMIMLSWIFMLLQWAIHRLCSLFILLWAYDTIQRKWQSCRYLQLIKTGIEAQGKLVLTIFFLRSYSCRRWSSSENRRCGVP